MGFVLQLLLFFNRVFLVYFNAFFLIINISCLLFLKGINGKTCLDNYDESYHKQLHGWYGALQRQLQRSQYQMQYNRHVQITIWAVILLCLIGRLWIFVCILKNVCTCILSDFLAFIIHYFEIDGISPPSSSFPF